MAAALRWAWLAEMLAGGLNANLGGRDHAPILVERQVIAWRGCHGSACPAESSGLLVTGTSIANLIGVLVARRAILGAQVRTAGLRGAALTAYAAQGAHGCVARAMDMAGIGSDALRLIPLDAARRMDQAALADRVAQDRAEDRRPFLVVGTAGSVDTGAIDDLAAIAEYCAPRTVMVPRRRRVRRDCGAVAPGCGRCWMASAAPIASPSTSTNGRRSRTIAAASWCATRRASAMPLPRTPITCGVRRAGWPADSHGRVIWGRTCRAGSVALKVWMTLRAYGTDRLGRVAEQCCALATRLADRISREPALELLAPVPLNIVCFRVRGADDAFNAALVADLHEEGSFAPSTTRIDGRLAIRAAIVNHRTTAEDVDGLVEAVLDKARHAGRV